MSTPSLRCSPVGSTGFADFGSERTRRYAAAVPLPLLQWWRGPGCRPRQRATARIAYDTGELCLYAVLEDHDIRSDAVRDNQRLWCLGDVVEFFVKPGADRDDYWEIHVSPNGLIMDIRVPRREDLLEKRVSWDEVIAADSGSRRTVRSWPERDLWAVELRVPWSAFGLTGAPAAGSAWQAAVCRYDYTEGDPEPELSSTAQLSKLHFHRHEEFHRLVFV